MRDRATYEIYARPLLDVLWNIESEERPRAALFRPEGEKRPLIWPLERRGQLFHSKVHAYLSAMIGDGRHISSEARTRPLFADRATGSKCYTNRVKRDSYSILPFMFA